MLSQEVPRFKKVKKLQQDQIEGKVWKVKGENQKLRSNNEVEQA